MWPDLSDPAFAESIRKFYRMQILGRMVWKRLAAFGFALIAA
jgi:hypothetical protein